MRTRGKNDRPGAPQAPLFALRIGGGLWYAEAAIRDAAIFSVTFRKRNMTQRVGQSNIWMLCHGDLHYQIHFQSKGAFGSRKRTHTAM